MRTKVIFAVAVISFLSFTGTALSAEFIILGPRALGMGGAQVAAVDDVTAVYWNPAAIAACRQANFSLPLGIQIAEYNDITGTLSDIDDVLGGYDLDDPEIYLDPAKITQIIDLFGKLDEPGTELAAHGNIGLLFSRGNTAFGMLDLAYLRGWVDMDMDRIEAELPAHPNSIANNESRATALGLESREFIATYTTRQGQVFIGTNAKYILGRSYYKSVSVADEDNDFDEDLEKMSDSNFAFDAGLLHPLPGSNLKAGLVVRNLNSPSFSYEDGVVELKPQARAGIAWRAGMNLLIACDLDLTENETMTPGYDSRTLAVGLEKKTPGGNLALRAGVYKNLAESDADPVFTGGIGIGSPQLKFDIGAGISPGPDVLALSFAFSTVF